jgi:hypothetical protein
MALIGTVEKAGRLQRQASRVQPVNYCKPLATTPMAWQAQDRDLESSGFFNYSLCFRRRSLWTAVNFSLTASRINSSGDRFLDSQKISTRSNSALGIWMQTVPLSALSDVSPPDESPMDNAPP